MSNRETSTCGFPGRDRTRSVRPARCNNRNKLVVPLAPSGRAR
jgi:hypothetical protein